LKRLAEIIAFLVVRRPFAVIAVTVAILGACAWLLTSSQRLDSEVLNLLPAGSEGVQALKVFKSEFRQGRELVFALHGAPDAVADFEEFFIGKLRAEPWVERVFTGPPMESPEELQTLQRLIPQLLLNLDETSFSETVAALTPEALTQRVQRLKRDIDSSSPRAEMEAAIDPLGLVGKAMRPMSGVYGMEQGQGLVSEDGSLKLFPVVTRQPTLNQADCRAVMRQVEEFQRRTVAEWTDGPAPEILVTGRTAYVSQIAQSMERDVRVTSTLTFLVVTLLFFIGFRRLVPPIGTSIVLAVACFVSFTIGALIFDNLNMIAIAFCSILVGLGDDFSLLLYNRYLLARTHREDHQTAVATAIYDMGRGIIYVSLTTGAGFLVLLFSGSSGFAQLGTLIAIGIVCCAIAVIVLLFLFIRPTHSHPDSPDPLHDFFDGLTRLLLRRRVGLSVAAGVLAVAAFVYAVAPVGQLQFDTNPRSLEPKQIPGAMTLRLINEKIPAASEPVMMLLQSTDAETAHRDWTRLDAHLRGLAEAGVLRSFSSPSALMLSPVRLQKNREALRAKVDLDQSRAAFLQALETEGFKSESFAPALTLLDEIKAAVSSKAERFDPESVLPPSSSWWFLLDRYLAMKPLLAAGYLRPAVPINTPAEQAVFEEKVRAAGVPIAITGWSYTMVGLVPWAYRELLVFSVAVGALILVSMALAYRAWKPLLVHTASLVFALGALVTLLKLTHTPINMLNSLAFPLVLGVGVDYGMHLLLALTEAGDKPEHLRTVVKPLVISGLTTIAGFGSLIFALNPALKGLGTVCALGVASCLVTSVFFAVPLLAVLGMEPARK
jgi:predicted exporter